jgi:hypothetical protein
MTVWYIATAIKSTDTLPSNEKTDAIKRNHTAAAGCEGGIRENMERAGSSREVLIGMDYVR